LGNLQFNSHFEEVTMPAPRNFLARQRDQISKRLDELRPLYDEYLALEKAQEALERLEEPVRRVVRRGRKPGRPRRRGRPPGRRATATKARAGRKAPSTRRRKPAGGTRADDAVKAIRAKPGITIPELAQKLKIRPNYLYRVTAQLQKERRIKKRGRGFHAA
jgi:hypothetical protein